MLKLLFYEWNFCFSSRVIKIRMVILRKQFFLNCFFVQQRASDSLLENQRLFLYCLWTLYRAGGLLSVVATICWWSKCWIFTGPSISHKSGFFWKSHPLVGMQILKPHLHSGYKDPLVLSEFTLQRDGISMRTQESRRSTTQSFTLHLWKRLTKACTKLAGSQVHYSSTLCSKETGLAWSWQRQAIATRSTSLLLAASISA